MLLPRAEPNIADGVLKGCGAPCAGALGQV